jgi:hypothetical protein
LQRQAGLIHGAQNLNEASHPRAADGQHCRQIGPPTQFGSDRRRVPTFVAQPGIDRDAGDTHPGR